MTIAAQMDESDNKALAGKKTEFTYTIPTDDGDEIWETLKGPIRDSENRITGLYGIARNVTEKMEVCWISDVRPSRASEAITM